MVHVLKYTHPRQDRLTVARSLGHYFLHYLHAGLSGEVRFMREISGATRQEVNLFAYELLLPREKFISCWGDGWNSTADEHEQRVLLRTAARQFDVYSDMVKTWAEYLGLLPQ